MHTTATHTPGPWRTGVDNTIYNAETNKRIADVYMHQIYRDSDMQALANTRLIAAAPELLEALKEVLGSLGGKPGVMHLPCIHQGRNAIAKAEGN